MTAPDAPELADRAAGWAGAYVHIPFCARQCPYCDFTVVVGRDEDVDRYLGALTVEIASEPPWRPLDAVYVGGGTPTRFGARRLAAVVEVLADRFGLTSDAEVGLEANPEDWTPEMARELVAAGFGRVSFGAQSFDRRVLAALGRCHTPDDVARAVEVAREAGFGSVNLDLIYGHPVEDGRSWTTTVEAALDLAPDHLSVYALTVEPGTELWRDVRAGGPAPDPDVQADRWEEVQARAEAAGLVRYEVSNLARPGHACRYNLAVWARGEYLGFGVGAHGFRDGVRRANVRRLDTYLDRVQAGLGAVQSSDLVSGAEAERERLMLGLRRAAGVALGPGGEAFVASDEGRRLLDAGVVEVRGGRLVVLRPLLTDLVIRSVLG